jgi:hypothetical protein
MNLSVRTLVIGFVAGAISVVVFHQGMVLLLYFMGQTPNFPWNLTAMKGPYPIPTLVNQMFWGGLWGVGFAAVGHMIPIAHNILRGVVFGLLGPFLLGNGLLVPLLKSTGQFFWTWPAPRYMVGGLIGAAFGAGLAVVMRAISKR